ncbi:MAG: hypothetical protein OXT67_12945 [Zetaproteobacteria bacterium]|nr:hypothetical protein [Zetaproteobacteria bacterium]
MLGQDTMTFVKACRVKKRRTRSFLWLSLCILVSVSCGKNGGTLVRNFGYALDETQVGVELELHPQLALNVGGSMPIHDFGQLWIEPATMDVGVKVQILVDTELMMRPEGAGFVRTALLPSGVSFPSYVETDLRVTHGVRMGEVRPSVYLGLSSDQFYLGCGLELAFVDHEFPAGLSISQLIRTADGSDLGVLAFYGPSFDAEGALQTPGGLFFATNVSVLSTLKKGTDIYLSAHDARAENNQQAVEDGRIIVPSTVLASEPEYTNRNALFRLFRQFRKNALVVGAWVR